MAYTIRLVQYFDNVSTGEYYQFDYSYSYISRSNVYNYASAGGFPTDSDYELAGIRNYSSWITWDGTYFRNLSSSSINYININYTYVEPIVYRTMNLKCGDGIDYYDVYAGSTLVRRITSHSNYEQFSVASGTSLTLENVHFLDGYSGIKWWYNSSSAYSYPNKSTTSPDYSLTSTYDRWGYFEATTYTPPTYTYYYRARLFVDGTLSDYVNGSVTSQSSTGYNFTLQEVKNMLTIPSGLTFSYAAAGNSYCSYSNGYFSLSSSAQSYRAYMDLYYITTTYTLTIYHYYNGATQSTEYVSITSGNTVYPHVYADTPSGYQYDHAESPWGTTVSSIVMSSNKSVFLIYSRIAPTTPTASITVTGRTSSSLAVSATLTNTLVYSDAWYLCISTNSSFTSYQTIQGSGTTASGTFSGLNAHTTYYFKVVNVYNSQYAWQSGYTTGTTKYANFVWDNGNNIDNRRPTANEWNRLVTFVETVCSTTIPQSIKNTIYVGGTLTASLFNALSSATNLNTVVSTGSRIYKTVLNALRDKANEHT